MKLVWLLFSLILLTATDALARTNFEPKQLSAKQLQSLISNPSIESFMKEGDLQTAAWLLRDAGKKTEAFALEAHIRFILSHGKILSKGLTQDHSAAVLNFEGNVQAVIKTYTGLRQSSLPYNEIFVYHLDRLLKFDLVPTTVVRNVDQKLASLQILIKNTQRGGVDFRLENYTDDQLYALDFITENLDRHGGNWLKTIHKKVIAIDNSIIFGHPLCGHLKELVPDRVVTRSARSINSVLAQKLLEHKNKGDIKWLAEYEKYKMTISPQIIELRIKDLAEASLSCNKELEK